MKFPFGVITQLIIPKMRDLDYILCNYLLQVSKMCMTVLHLVINWLLPV